MRENVENGFADWHGRDAALPRPRTSQRDGPTLPEPAPFVITLSFGDNAKERLTAAKSSYSGLHIAWVADFGKIASEDRDDGIGHNSRG